MSWLHQLLNSLNTEEINSLQTIAFKGKEKEVFTIYLNKQNCEEPEKQVICASLNITSTHFYKINSVIIEKIYKHFFKDNVLDLIEFLSNRHLFNLLKTEIIHYIKNIKKHSENCDKILLEFFRKSIDFPFNFYDEKLVNNVGEKYLLCKKNRTDADDDYVFFHKLFADCNRFAATRKPEKYFTYNASQLKAFETKLIAKKHYLALYYLYRTFVNYYSFYETNAEIQMVYLEKAINLKHQIKNYFPIDIGVLLDLLKADVLFSNKKFEQSFSLYESLFNKGVDKEVYGYLYHCEQFALIATILKFYNKAEIIINNTFYSAIEYKEGVFATRGLLAYSKLYMATGEYKKAIQKLNLAMEINQKSFYLPFDLQIRVLECLLFYFKKDYDFCKQLIQRNQKFLISLSSKKKYEIYFKFCSVVSHLISSKERNQSITNSIKLDIDNLHYELVDVYGNLFLKLKD